MDAADRSLLRSRIDLFLVSLLVLFLELACIRWFPAHVLFLTFFTNLVLLACFLGLSVGCLAANRPRRYLTWTPALLVIAMLGAHGVNVLRWRLQNVLDAGQRGLSEVVLFGAEPTREDLARFAIPVEALNGFFFLVLALAMVGPGQALGKALSRLPDRVSAYTINIAGSLLGIGLFSLCSWAELSPFWWFLPVVLGLGYFLLPLVKPSRPLGAGLAAALLFLILGLASWTSGKSVENGQLVAEHHWSPYYRIDYSPRERVINTNLISHQVMIPRADCTQAVAMQSTDGKQAATPSMAFGYCLPYLLDRDARAVTNTKERSFDDVLVIGAGSGNDVSRALQFGARRVDAVEIDPVVQGLGRRHHPDQPYDDPRVTAHLDDGRNFLRSTERQYDLIVYALVDSLVLHSSYSNVRLESYLFTRQAFEDVRRRLKPGGTFVMYNYFRQGWIVSRLKQGVEQAFGAAPLVLAFPRAKSIEPDSRFNGYTVLFAGDTKHLKDAFAWKNEYWLNDKQAPGLTSPNGFTNPGTADRRELADPAQGWGRFAPAEVKQPQEPLRSATDDWPFLYVRAPMIPDLSWRGMAVMGGLSLALLFFFRTPKQSREPTGGLGLRMFFLGAGFMLVETKAVVNMALLLGSTWMVNSLVFAAVLAMILLANLWVILRRPEHLGVYYAGLFAALALNALLPLDVLLGLERTWQLLAAGVLLAAPILFAGVIFAVSFARCEYPDRAFGANIAGAMLGGIAENLSMLIGFQYLVLVAVGFYALSALWGWRRPVQAAEPQVLATVAELRESRFGVDVIRAEF
ncbi:MAG: hypothetical protein K2R98_12990 [Gemmataceae bacterium]|nr:hypothetical protein [Gemmataceae bacterium]